MAESDTSSTRMGRFRICPPPNSPGPPNEQMSHGRFRIIPQGKTHTNIHTQKKTTSAANSAMQIEKGLLNAIAKTVTKFL